MPVRAVLDPNVLVSALISPRGLSARLLVVAEEGGYELLVSNRLLAELEDVLRREKFRSYVTLPEVTEYLIRLRLLGTQAEEGEVVPISPDPKDDYLVALARSSGAEYLVSGDRHLHDLQSAVLGRAVSVLTPRHFSDLLGAVE